MKTILNNSLINVLLLINERDNYSSKIYKKLKTHRGQLNKTLSRLEKQEFIIKYIDKKLNGKIKFIKLTPKGERVKELLIKLKQEIE